MEQRDDQGKKAALALLQAFAGYAGSMVGILGYYPFVPAIFAASMLWRRRSFFLYLGFVVGIAGRMELSATVKYLVLCVVIRITVQFYQWANRRCGGMEAGLIAGVCTVAMNYSGSVFSLENRTELVLGASEGLSVLGLTVLLHVLTDFLAENGRALLEYLSGTFRRTSIAEPAPADDRMTALAAAVDGLAEVFNAWGMPREEKGPEAAGLLEQELAGRLCASCDGCAVCWSDSRTDLRSGIREMIAAVIGHESREAIVESNYMESCTRYPDLVGEAIDIFGMMELNRAWYQRLLENRQLVAQQLDAMVELMNRWSGGEKCIDEKCRRMLRRIDYEAKERGISIKELHVYEDAREHRYYRALVATKWDGGIPSHRYLKAVEKATHDALRPQKQAVSLITPQWRQVTLYEETRFYTLPGIAMRKKDGSVMTGDNFAMFEMDEGQAYIALSDGMGSGERAGRESEMVVELLEKLIRAGFEKRIAIRLMNSAMVLQGENDRFSTLDLAEIDLYDGELSLTKIGAAASFLLHEGQVRCLTGDSLPAGADPQLAPERKTERLTPGDFLVMVTDGVLEYLPAEEPAECFAQMAAEAYSQNAGVMARSLLEQVLTRTGGRARDDMTILVTGIWEKT